MDSRHPIIEGKEHRKQSHEQQAEDRPGAVEEWVFTPVGQHVENRRRGKDIPRDALCRSACPRNDQHRQAEPGNFGIVFKAGGTGDHSDGQTDELG